MSFTIQQSGDLEYLTSSLLQGPVVHCFSTRRGGVSTGPLSSLNLGAHRGDRPGNVVKNYQILGRSVGFRPRQTVFARQVHSSVVKRVGTQECGTGLFFRGEGEYDGLITNEPGVALTVFSADCTPILLFDPVCRCIGAVHSGWRGTAAGIVKQAVAAMQAEFGSDPLNIQAAIGPCIGPCCFETHDDVPQAMYAALGELARQAITAAGETYHVDLKRLNRIWLEQAGVRQIDVSQDCTACQSARFWSHRRAGSTRGSLANIIMLTAT